MSSLIVWKKARLANNRPVIVKLGIPFLTQIYLGQEYGHNKCRASQAEVLSIETVKSKKALPNGTIAFGYRQFPYEVGNLVKPGAKFDIKPVCCASGIHFFLTRKEAERYS